MPGGTEVLRKTPIREKMRMVATYLFAVFLTHILLRCALLFRNDAFGHPFVSKPDWYIFHAVAIDFLWIVNYSLPFVAVMLFLSRFEFRKTLAIVFGILMCGHSLLLLLTVVDHEVARYWGVHLDASLIKTYGNMAAFRELQTMTGYDESVSAIPYLLFFLCVPFSIILFLTLRNRFSWPAKRTQFKVVAVILMAWISSYVFLYHIWGGGFRLRKLKPVIEVLRESANHKSVFNLNDSDLNKLSLVHQSQWLLEQGDSSFVFPFKEFPYYREPLAQACDRLRNSPELNPHPPRESLERLCADGLLPSPEAISTERPNFVLIVLESHRGLSSGFLQAEGASADGTPFLNSIAGSAKVWTRYSTSSLPTVSALVSIHNSVLSHPTRYISHNFRGLQYKAFTTILAEYGYRTHYFSSSDPSWDNQVPLLRNWYQGFTYDRRRENDADMFAHLGSWMKDSLNTKTPFMLTAVTKTNHFPFNEVAGMPPGKNESLQTKMLATMTYTESAVREFMLSIKDEPWYANTVFVFVGDHGFPLGEHGSSNLGHGLYTESTWVPLVIYGKHPAVRGSGKYSTPASHLDLGPTLLDIAGIKAPNHFLGHSLLRMQGLEHSLSYTAHGFEGTMELGRYRVHGSVGREPRELGREVFDMVADRGQFKNLYPEHPRLYDSLMIIMDSKIRLNTYLVENNRLWSDTISPAPPSPDPALSPIISIMNRLSALLPN